MSKKDSNWKDIPWHHGDMMDYDGMGNHGRFPPQYPHTHKKANRALNVLLLICVVVGLLLIVVNT